jgi:hypothetical protein
VRRHAPLASRGRRAARWAEHQAEEADAATEGLVCTICRRRCYPDPHHIFGRRRVREPLSSYRELISPLCRLCHSAWHNQVSPPIAPEVKLRIQWDALRALAERVEVDPPCVIGDPTWKPLDVLRWYERELEDCP